MTGVESLKVGQNSFCLSSAGIFCIYKFNIYIRNLTIEFVFLKEPTNSRFNLAINSTKKALFMKLLQKPAFSS